jgi:hypothetical protein
MTGNPLETCGDAYDSGVLQDTCHYPLIWCKDCNHITFAWIQDSTDMLASST